jgi:hypothetical protein
LQKTIEPPGGSPQRLTEFSTRPAFCSIEHWCAISGMGRRSTYSQLGSGNLRAIKVGTRTLIDVEVGLEWLRSQPMAVIRPSRTALPSADKPAAGPEIRQPRDIYANSFVSQ